MCRRSRQIAAGITVALAAGFLGLAAQHTVNKPAQKVVLVELFTSEGCSSCPPADALLRQVNGAETTEGQLIVGISEHVTYWNSLGWSDPFPLPSTPNDKMTMLIDSTWRAATRHRW